VRTKQFNEAVPTDINFDAIGSDIDPANQRHQHGADPVWRKRFDLFRDFNATSD
jgi:hypothetical protein